MCKECEEIEICAEVVKENREQEKVRKVFLDDLPRWGKGGRGNEGTINWQESIGYKVKFQYDDIEGEIEILDYNIKNHEISIKYLNKNNFKIKTGGFTNCKLTKLLNKRTRDFKIEIKAQFKDDKRDLIIIDREYRLRKTKTGIINEKWYNYHCNECGYESWLVEGHLIEGNGCSCCNGKVAVLGINTIWDTDRWMCDLGVSEEDAKKYTYRSGKTIIPKCPNCGQVKNKPISISNIYHHHSIGCKKCSDGISYPNKVMFNILDQFNIIFQTEYSPKWCRYKFKEKLRKGKYDFYFELDRKKYIIEMDGEFHKKDNKMNGQTKEESQYIDDEKDRLAHEHGIEVIRIDSNYESDLEYIKNNILKSKLNDLFDLSNINWLKVEEFALSNRVREACKLKYDDQDLTTVEIGEIMKLNYTTIQKYLKKGNKLGWCEYNPEEEMFKGKSKSGKMSGKPIEVFRDNIFLGRFESCSELVRQSKKNFGVKLNNGCISIVCRGKAKQHLGFTFKYID